MKPGASFSPALASVRSASPFEWPRDISSAERKSLIAGGLGWMLDAMDVMLYSFVLAYLMTEFGITKSTGGLLNSLTLIASAIGGLFFGILADRIGRTRALMAAIVVLMVFPHFGWRAVFFAGVLPALLVLWIYRGVPEPEMWKNRSKEKKSGVFRKLLQRDVLRNGILATTMNAFSMFGYWGLF